MPFINIPRDFGMIQGLQEPLPLDESITSDVRQRMQQPMPILSPEELMLQAGVDNALRDNEIAEMIRQFRLGRSWAETIEDIEEVKTPTPTPPARPTLSQISPERGDIGTVPLDELL
jgi:hypothetical protein